jgi:hypothetical protein
MYIMADNKHSQLAKLMQSMLNEIDRHSEKVAECLNFVQLYFYEKKYIIGRPRMTIEIFKQMTKSHYIGLQQFSPSTKFKNICMTTPWLSAIVGQGIIYPGQMLHRQTQGWFVPWGVYITLPDQNQLKLKQNRQQTLLYGPTASEISKELDWFEKEDASNTLTHQLLTLNAHYNEKEILKRNFQQDPSPLYEEAIKEWYEHSTTDDVAKNPRNLDKTDFAPQSGQTLEHAYASVIKSTRERISQYWQNLRRRYRIKLERYMFTNLPWSAKEKMVFLEKQQAIILGLQTTAAASKKQGRWKQDAGIDCFTASKFIENFVLKFINNPLDCQSGEIACILWILIWCAQNDCGGDVSVEEVRTLSTKQLSDTNQFLLLKKCKIKVSQGLHQLLLCLRGKGTGERSLPLFSHVDKKTLERSLRLASKKILPKDATPVLPAAFLISPHLHQGARICATEREMMQNARQLVPPRYMSGEIKEILNSTIAKQKSKNP